MLALLLALLAQDPTTLQFEAPAKSKLDDAKAAAAALQARCTAIGYPGITSKAFTQKGVHVVELARKDGFTAAMIARIRGELLTNVTPQPDFVRLGHELVGAERDLYMPAKGAPLDAAAVAKWKSPAGTSWVLLEAGGRRWAELIHTGAMFSSKDFKGERFKKGDAGDGYRLLLNEAATKRFMALDPKAQAEAFGPIYSYAGAHVLLKPFQLIDVAGKKIAAAEFEIAGDDLVRFANPLAVELSTRK